MLRSEPSSGWKTCEKVMNSPSLAWPSAYESLAPSAVTAVVKAGSSPGRPGGQSGHSAASTRRAARLAMVRQKLMGTRLSL